MHDFKPTALGVCIVSAVEAIRLFGVGDGDRRREVSAECTELIEYARAPNGDWKFLSPC